MNIVNVSDVHYFSFGGGGVRGIAFAGALDEWFKLTRYDIKNLKGASGTSIGALYAAAIAVGLSPASILEITQATNLMDLVTIDVTNLVSYWGFDTGHRLTEWIENHIGTITFKELFDTTGRILKLAVTNLNSGKVEYLSHATYPNLKVSTGVTMSMCLPPVFSPMNMNGALFVDGGLLDNYPIRQWPAENVLGFRVSWSHCPKLDAFEKYFSRVTYCATALGSREAFRNLEDGYKKRSLTVDCGDVATINWRLPPSTINHIVGLGRGAVRSYVLANGIQAERKKRTVTTQSTQTT